VKGPRKKKVWSLTRPSPGTEKKDRHRTTPYLGKGMAPKEGVFLWGKQFLSNRNLRGKKKLKLPEIRGGKLLFTGK